MSALRKLIIVTPMPPIVTTPWDRLRASVRMVTLKMEQYALVSKHMPSYGLDVITGLYTSILQTYSTGFPCTIQYIRLAVNTAKNLLLLSEQKGEIFLVKFSCAEIHCKSCRTCDF